METGKILHGSANLAFDATHAITHIVEGMYRNIAATPWPLAREPEGPAPGIAGFVHEAVRRINMAVRHPADRVLGHVAPGLDRTAPPGPYRDAVIAALNGICGDHLHRSANPLAIPMQLRALLPTNSPPVTHSSTGHAASGRSSAMPASLARLVDLEKRSVEIYPQPHALDEPDFSPGGKLLILVHGLSMSERSWTNSEHNHAQALASMGDFTPLYLRYNSGLNISTNGRALSEQLSNLLESWPAAVESITFIGFSMGGLVTRSALHIAEEENQPWLGRVDKAVYIGSPHHGAVLERGGFWLQKGLSASPYTAPLAALGRIRSAGVTDLRHGNIRDDDWRHKDEHEDNADHRLPTPLPKGIGHYAIAGTLSNQSGDRIGKLLGDGLVHPSSATGRHDNSEHQLDFPRDQTRIFYSLGHLAMLSDPRVMRQLQDWLL